VQTAARQDVGGQHHVQFALLQRGLRIEGHAGFKVHLHLRPFCTENLQRRRQPLNATVAFDGNTQRRLLRLVAVLKRPADLRQHLIRQLQQDLALRRKAQRLTFTHK